MRLFLFQAFGFLSLMVLTTTLTSEAHADAKLLHFDGPASERVPGQYYVLFKTERELRQLPRLFANPTSGVKKPRVLPGNLPTTTHTSRVLAKALAASVHGRVIPPYECPYEGRQGFWIQLPEKMVNILAKDPRIESLEPNPIIHPTTNQQTLSDPPTGPTAPNNRWRGP